MPIAPLPRPAAPTAAAYRDFLDALRAAGFAGEIRADYANRTVQATDNSIYQRLPQAVVCPSDVGDVERLARLLAQPAHRGIVVAPRGGGTGTNGQSLTDGLVVDLSRNLNRILEIDVKRRRVRVQAGVVKDQLNAALKPHGLFFAPELSTSNRATIGGMINTDASGQGSCTYGKTRDHVLALEFVLPGGERLHSTALPDDELARRCARQDRIGEVYRTARRISDDHAALIEAKFPKLNRCLTGYDLAHLREADGRFNLNSVLCGAEGSLGFVVEATLNVLPIPKYSVLVNVRYAGFMEALRDARALLELKPLSIETVDSTVLMLAMKDFVWSSVADYFPQDDRRPTLGINLIEFSGDDADEVDARVRAFVEHLRADTTVERLGHTIAAGDDAVKRVYAMRKRAVGLLGNVQGEARPQPFVEDTAVPPENLAAYIAEFRALLDGYGLRYGMFGHVDAGVLHVRPALDMKDPKQAALVRPVSDAVAALTQRHGGLLWGEHGKGVRSEYAPAFFGELYPALQQLKAAFDPHNQFNPGKIATPPQPAMRLLKIDEVPTRGEHDRQIDERVWQSYGTAMHCNGNGACYNFDPDDAMCPSWKATRERVHSPKGRASLMREWLRLQGEAGADVLAAARERQPWLRGFVDRWRNTRAARRGEADFSHDVYDAMAGCLACKSCAGQCPVKVSVPEFRSRFLELYHQRYLRPLRDYLIGSLEFTVPWFARVPALYNGLMRAGWVRTLFERHVGMVDSPLLSRFDLAAVIRQWNVRPADPHALAALTDAQRARSVVIVQDTFTRYFDTEQLATLIELAARLGFHVWLAPLAPNGKALHVQGFLRAFERAAIRNATQLAALARAGVALVGVDPAITLTYRQEYRKVPGLHDVPPVALPQEWLLDVLPDVRGNTRADTRAGDAARAYRLLPHCTEKTNAPDSGKQWVQVFARRGLRLQVQPAGCCGMSGTYGHEARNVDTSRTIYAQSWAAHVDAPEPAGEALATGYSCRSQVKRMSARQVRHPLQVLLDHVRAAQ
ncbi:FAD-binding oxidoreductase [Burkholderia multivorans]|uniref:D-2-hydroxyglutarate dehydrogenase n=1 Tax=Burkholderia multivorans CGD2 TaxID=513052 RepID=B9BPJ0_9BURK|nr:FAD-binding and (Fe-S)-binding domain-containing protein [Burkholderia multivorans]AVR20034.1 FAD-binding oxidoreductase [Burkholderia multivorans]EEE07508.1 FAD linked oxidase domain protein [Burkholderia multivorans CGD2]EEE13880.1 FAD linked oxidase domain protein [Burkholderia multivorans CGD2M]EJO63308.1 FAD linked oxidase, C-terminal domain protein [Burkholderia multivorans ATCC BAA-247]EKS9913727.1 FAD-binding oxidoreductase [Burkholderia multivorans]